MEIEAVKTNDGGQIRVAFDKIPYLKMGKEKYECSSCGAVAYYQKDDHAQKT